MKSIIWGIVLVTLGVLLGGRAAGLFEFDIFFDGWWTLFIIIPCFFPAVRGIMSEKEQRRLSREGCLPETQYRNMTKE